MEEEEGGRGRERERGKKWDIDDYIASNPKKKKKNFYSPHFAKTCCACLAIKSLKAF